MVLLVKDHSVIPHVAVAQSTKDIDWKNIELRVFSTDGMASPARIAMPNADVKTVAVTGSKKGFAVTGDPFAGEVKWTVTSGRQ